MPAPILTHHAQERLKQRAITEQAIESVLRSPERTEPGSKPESVKFVRTLNGRQIHVVAKYLQAQDRWLVLSVWVRGEDDNPSLLWQVLAAPVKVCWWSIRQIFKVLLTSRKQRR